MVIVPGHSITLSCTVCLHPLAHNVERMQKSHCHIVCERACRIPCRKSFQYSFEAEEPYYEGLSATNTHTHTQTPSRSNPTHKSPQFHWRKGQRKADSLLWKKSQLCDRLPRLLPFIGPEVWRAEIDDVAKAVSGLQDSLLR